MAGILHMHDVLGLNLDRREIDSDASGARVLVVQAISQSVSQDVIVVVVI